MNFAKYITVLFTSMIKFVGGPISGLALKLSWYETAIFTAIGMMCTVFLMLFLEGLVVKLRSKFFKSKAPKKVFSKTKRLAVKVRQKFGLMGVAFLTPLLFTPIGGTLLAVAFKYSRGAILWQMLLSAVFWSIGQTLFFYYVKHLIF